MRLKTLGEEAKRATNDEGDGACSKGRKYCHMRRTDEAHTLNDEGAEKKTNVPRDVRRKGGVGCRWMLPASICRHLCWHLSSLDLHAAFALSLRSAPLAPTPWRSAGMRLLISRRSPDSLRLF
jgi:hypothetical protein